MVYYVCLFSLVIFEEFVDNDVVDITEFSFLHCFEWPLIRGVSELV